MSQLGELAVPKLVYRYAELIDAGDFAGLGELFAHASVTSGNGVPAHGRDEVQAKYEQWTRRYEDGTPHTKHVTTNLIVDVDEDAGTATCRSYVIVFQATETLPLQPIYAGRYHDTFERAEGVWRFASRTMIADGLGDLSAHLLQKL